MRRDPKCFLWDIQQAAEAILESVSGKSSKTMSDKGCSDPQSNASSS